MNAASERAQERFENVFTHSATTTHRSTTRAAATGARRLRCLHKVMLHAECDDAVFYA